MKVCKPKLSDRPCCFQEWNPRKNMYIRTSAAVDCVGTCWECGWNPEEKERRLRTGEWVEEGGIRTLKFLKWERPV